MKNTNPGSVKTFNGKHFCPSVSKGPLTDFSKRSRGAKFRLVPKFKKEKNNKNKETCATFSLPGNICLSLWD